MHKLLFRGAWLWGLLLCCLNTLKAQDAVRYPVIPKPLKLIEKVGYFDLNAKTKIVLGTDDPDVRPAVDYFASMITSSTGNHLSVSSENSSRAVTFELDSSIVSEEGYTLQIDTSGILIKSKTGRGTFYAVQTLRQLMSAEIEVKNSGVENFRIPAVEIEDAPRFAYRGLMLDVSRYFFEFEFLKRYIDLMAFYKINTFHLHLTDDQGWRIEIKKYPLLHKISSKRTETWVGHRGDLPAKFDGKPHGGYYTQKQLKELVSYAQKRYITIIPEIDIPGHTQAVLAAYPKFGCKNDTTYNVSTNWGVHKDVLCPKEETFKFLEDVFSELIAIFPSKYIHIGGDEVPKDRWKESAFCQQLIQKLKLKDEHGLQSYFIQRMEKFLNSKGRNIIGWDEILEGGLAPKATVMSWRGEKGGIEAARQRHNVIMTPSKFLYFNYYHTKDKRLVEPLSNIGIFLPLKTVYDYDPVPAVLSPEEGKFVLGLQGCIWTEYIPTSKRVENMTFPRACALAETAWTPAENKKYSDFIKRLAKHTEHLSRLDVPYSRYYENEY